MSLKKSANPSKIRILLVDDHSIVRKGLRLMLSLHSDFSICGEADTGPAALEKAVASQPHVAIVDLELKEGSGLELIKQLRSACPEVKIIVFTMHAGGFFAERVMRAGIHGYLTKEQGAEQMVEAIRAVLRGQTYIGELTVKQDVDYVIPDAKASVEALSDRELEILRFLGQGWSTRQISEKLHLSIKTVSTHRENIKHKLGIQNSPELIVYAHNWLQNEKGGS